jgi:hypothetical protein
MSANPVHYWRFSEASGTVARDETGTSNGTYAAGVQHLPGAIGGDADLALGGSPSYAMRSPAPGALTGTATRSYEFWFKTEPGQGRATLLWHGGLEISTSYIAGGNLGYATAGHCGVVGDFITTGPRLQTTFTRAGDNEVLAAQKDKFFRPVGTMTVDNEPNGLDMAFVACSTNCLNGRVWVGGTGSRNTDALNSYYTREVNRDGWCMSGATSDFERCGYEFVRHASYRGDGVKFKRGMWLKNPSGVGGQEGDSGAPVYRTSDTDPNKLIYGGVASAIGEGGLLIVASSWEIYEETGARPAASPEFLNPLVAIKVQNSGGQYTAVGTYEDGSLRDVTQEATWSTYDYADPSSTRTSWIVVDAGGSIRTAFNGFFNEVTIVRASLRGVVSTQSPLIGGTYQIEYPDNLILARGSSFQFKIDTTYPDPRVTPPTNPFAAARYPTGGVVDLTSNAIWNSSNSSSLSISDVPGSKGFAQGIASGQSTVTASFVLPERPEAIFTRDLLVSVQG